MQLPRERRCKDDKRSKLGVITIVAMAALISSCFAVLVVLGANHDAAGTCKEEELSYENVWLAFWMDSGVLLLAAFAVASYIRVGVRAPRPCQLHRHGLLLVTVLLHVITHSVGTILWCNAMHVAALITVMCRCAIWGYRKVVLIGLTLEKIAAMGAPPSHPLFQPEYWGYVAMASGAFTGSCAIVASLCQALVEEPRMSSGALIIATHDSWMHVVRAVALWAGAGTAACFTVSCIGFAIAAWHKMITVLRKLASRDVNVDAWNAARLVLRRHLLGLIVFLITTVSVLITAMILVFDGQSALEPMVMVLNVIDWSGDLVGIVFLSGIGALLIKEDADTGDLNGSIRSLLHAAVLTSRADAAFEGKVIRTPDNRCIASFPGKFVPEWKSLTWQCEQGELSSACVFLPTSDAQKRFGQHAATPDAPHICWCHRLYGEQKPWGCMWFEAWRANIEQAVALGLQLVVVFFPGQAGHGKVKWVDLGSSNLWNDVGLGGSQKAEAAYLELMGYAFVEEDINTCLGLP